MSVVNELDYDGTETVEWNAPQLHDFGHDSDWDGLDRETQMDVVRHFLVTAGTNENPPDDFNQLKLPVVNPGTGKLNKHALDNAHARLPQTNGIDDVEDEIEENITTLQEEEFDE